MDKLGITAGLSYAHLLSQGMTEHTTDPTYTVNGLYIPIVWTEELRTKVSETAHRSRGMYVLVSRIRGKCHLEVGFISVYSWQYLMEEV